MLVLFAIDISLVLAFALCVAAALPLPARPARWPAQWVAAFILGFADVVLAAEVLGGAGLLKAPLFLPLHALTAAAGLALWIRAGKPSLFAFPSVDRREAAASIRRSPELWLLAAGVAAVFLVGAWLIVTVPPNNYDSMTYHLSRVGYWMQQGSFKAWPTSNLRQTISPMNAEIGVLWTVIFTRSDRLAGFVQWGAAIGAMMAIYGLARALGHSRAQGVFAALVWATFPEVVLQSTSTQNDLVVAALLASAIYLFIVGIQADHRGSLLLSGMALGLALGAKLTAAMALPGLALGALFVWLKEGRAATRSMLFWKAACLGSFLLWGAYGYALNYLTYGHLLGPASFLGENVRRSSGLDWRAIESNALRYLYQSADLTGVPERFRRSIQRVKARAALAAFQWLGVEANPASNTKQATEFLFDEPAWAHEDYAWFGPLGFMLGLSSIVWRLVAGIVRKDGFRFMLAATAAGFFLMVCAFLVWDPWRGRLFTLATAVAAPLMAMFYGRGRLLAPLRWVVVVVALVVAAKAMARNENKALIGSRAIWGKDRIAQRFQGRAPFEPLAREVEKIIPENACLGITVGGDDWDYPLFGERFTRRITPVWSPPEKIDSAWLEQHNFTYYIARDIYCDGRLDLPPEQYVIRKTDCWRIVCPAK